LLPKTSERPTYPLRVTSSILLILFVGKKEKTKFLSLTCGLKADSHWTRSLAEEERKLSLKGCPRASAGSDSGLHLKFSGMAMVSTTASAAKRLLRKFMW
jgi:hypothetical protein